MVNSPIKLPKNNVPESPKKYFPFKIINVLIIEKIESNIKILKKIPSFVIRANDNNQQDAKPDAKPFIPSVRLSEFINNKMQRVLKNNLNSFK